MITLTRQLIMIIQVISRACAAQVRCVEVLLRAGAAMTQEQLTIVLQALPALGSPRVSLLYLQYFPHTLIASSMRICSQGAFRLIPVQCTIDMCQLPSVSMRAQVARSAWRLLHRHAAMCAQCGLIGCWSSCKQCRAAFYCSTRCQK